MPSSLLNAGGVLLSASILTTTLFFVGLRKDHPVDPKLLADTQIRWYGDEAPNKYTANGEVFDPSGMTYASRTDKFDTWITVTYGNQHVTVRCNDRGPNKIELTEGAFSVLAPLWQGVIEDAKVRYITNAD